MAEKSTWEWDRDPEKEDGDTANVEKWEGCPRCGSGEMEYIGEGYDDDEHLGSSYKCHECNHHWVEGEEY